MSFLHPRDSRWQGSARWYIYLDLVKNIILSLFIILVIVEGTIYRHWYMAYHSTVEFDSSETAAEWFIRIGLALIPDIFSTLLTHSLLYKSAFHPVYALTQSLVTFCLYPSALFLNFLIAYSDERGYPYIDAWQRLCWAEMGLQGLLAVVWVGMVGCACIAVHKWRGEKKAGRLMVMVKDDIELAEGEARRDSANGEVERGGDVSKSAKSARAFL